jgi:hypothetical protein
MAEVVASLNPLKPALKITVPPTAIWFIPELALVVASIVLAPMAVKV